MAEVWHWAPNTLFEVLDFTTEILPTRGLERRVSYVDAIQKMSFGHVVSPSVAEAMIMLYLSDPDQTFLIPEWPTASFSNSVSVNPADTQIPVIDDVVYEVGQQVFFGVGDLWEQGEIASLGGTSITLTQGVSGSYSGSENEPFFIAPLIESICPAGAQYQKRFPIRGLSFEFVSVSPIDIPESTYATFEGLPYVDDGDAMFDELAGSAGRASILADSGFGSFEIVKSENYTRRSGTLSFFDANYADRLRRRRFFHFMRGRDGEMWISSDQPDMVLNAGFSSSAISVDIVPVAPAAQMVGQVVQISQGGNSAIRRVTSAVDNGLTSQSLQIASVGFGGTSEARVSFMTKCRFDADNIDIEYGYSKDGLLARCLLPTLEVI